MKVEVLGLPVFLPGMSAPRRRARWVIAGVGVLGGALLVGLWMVLPNLIERAAPRLGERFGVPGVSLRVESLRWNGLSLADLRAGAEGEFSVGSVRLAYGPSSLRRGQIELLEIADVRLRAVLSETGLSLPPFDAWLAAADGPAPDDTGSPSSGASLPLLPARLVRLTGLHVDLRSADAAVVVEVDGPTSIAVEGEGATLEALLTLRVKSEELEILAAGDLEVRGDLRPGDGGLIPDLRVLVRDFSATWEETVVEGVDGELPLTGLPPVTPRAGRLEVDRVVSGSELSEGVIRFRIDETPHLLLDEATFRFAGGSFRATGRLDPAAERQRLHVVLSRIDLDLLLEQADVPGLTGTGRIDGGFDVIFGDGTLRIEDGDLTSKGDGGWIRYRPPGQQRPGGARPEGLDLARIALDNFRYQSLGGTLAGDVGGDLKGDLKLALRIEGANPDLYDGYPIKLDFNLTGPFLGLMRSADTVTGVPKGLERRFREAAQ
jgi:hypothetical protein